MSEIMTTEKTGLEGWQPEQRGGKSKPTPVIALVQGLSKINGEKVGETEVGLGQLFVTSAPDEQGNKSWLSAAKSYDMIVLSAFTFFKLFTHTHGDNFNYDGFVKSQKEAEEKGYVRFKKDRNGQPNARHYETTTAVKLILNRNFGEVATFYAAGMGLEAWEDFFSSAVDGGAPLWASEYVLSATKPKKGQYRIPKITFKGKLEGADLEQAKAAWAKANGIEEDAPF